MTVTGTAGDGGIASIAVTVLFCRLEPTVQIAQALPPSAMK